jgi:hypothetical protein
MTDDGGKKISRLARTVHLSANLMTRGNLVLSGRQKSFLPDGWVLQIYPSHQTDSERGDDMPSRSECDSLLRR